jgi:polar amino acid transport system substrate-binding protein
MKKIIKDVLVSIIIINFIGIIMEVNASANSKITKITNLRVEDRVEAIKEKGKITVVVPPKEIPFIYINPETNKISGIDSDIINEIAKRLKVNKVEIKEAAFANLLEELNADDSIDMAAGGIFIIPDRENVAAFTKPLYKETEAVIVPKFSKINSVNDLKEAVVGVEKGTIFESLAKGWKGNNLIKEVAIFENTADLFNAISNGEIDAGLADSVIINYNLIKEKTPLLRILKDYTPKLEGVMGIAVKKNDSSLLNELNKIIDEMKADGTLYTILVDNGLNKNNIIMD